MKEIKVGIVGLGRLGSVHAQNLAFKIPGCKLVAACSLEQKELDWAKDYLKVEYTTTDYKKMVDEADIEGFGFRALRPALGLRAQRLRPSATIVLAPLFQTRPAGDAITFHDLRPAHPTFQMVEHSGELRLVIVSPVALAFAHERRLSADSV